MYESDFEEMIEKFKQGKGLKIIIGLIALFVLLTILNPFVTIDAGHRGVILNFGAVSDIILDEGLHFRVPIMQKIVEMDVQIQKSKTQADAATKDLQDTKFVIVVNFHISPDKVNWVYQKIGVNFEDRIIGPNVEESVKAVAAKYTAEQLITKRELVSTEIQNSLKEKLLAYNIIVDDFSIVDFDFSDQFTQAIEEKQTAEQKALKAERDLQRIKIEAKQKIEQSRAEAMSLRLKRLEVTPQLIKLREIDAQVKAIEKWDGKLPAYTGGAIPFINLNK